MWTYWEDCQVGKNNRLVKKALEAFTLGSHHICHWITLVYKGSKALNFVIELQCISISAASLLQWGLKWELWNYVFYAFLTLPYVENSGYSIVAIVLQL